MFIRNRSVRFYASSLLLVAGAFTVIAAIHQTVGKTVQADNYKYSVPGNGSLEIAGVCSTDTQNFNCWTPAGDPDPKLTEKVNAFFLVTPNALLQLRFRGPTYLIVTLSTGQSQPFAYLYNSNWTDDDGLRLTNAGQTPYSTGSLPFYNYYWLYPEASRKTDSLSVNYTGSFVFPTQLPLKVGASTESDGKTFTITGITEVTLKVPASQNPGYYGYVPNSNAKTISMKTWRIDYKRSDFPEMTPDSIYASISTSGYERRYTDNNGKPLASDQGRPPVNAANQFYVPKNDDNAFNKTGSFSIQTDPKYVNSIAIGFGTSIQINFPNIALQPKA